MCKYVNIKWQLLMEFKYFRVWAMLNIEDPTVTVKCRTAII